MKTNTALRSRDELLDVMGNPNITPAPTQAPEQSSARRAAPPTARAAAAAPSVMWTPGSTAPLNQGNEGACSAFATVGAATSAPTPPTPDGTGAGRLNDLANRLYDTYRSPATQLVELGACDSWRELANLDDLLNTLTTEGPVVYYGIWPRTLFDLSQDGYMPVKNDAATNNPGWHAVYIRGYRPSVALRDDQNGPAYMIRNSWGTTWGRTPNGKAPSRSNPRTGDGWIRPAALTRLVTASGTSFPDCFIAPVNRRRINPTLEAPRG